MKGGNQKSDNGQKATLGKAELISILITRRDTVLQMVPKLIVETEGEPADMQNHINNIIKKHLHNMVNQINSSIKHVEKL